MGDTYEVGIAVSGTRAALVIARGELRHAIGPWDTRTASAHGAALAAIDRARVALVDKATPVGIYLRQQSAAQAWNRDVPPLARGEVAVLWASEHPLIAAANDLLRAEVAP